MSTPNGCGSGSGPRTPNGYRWSEISTTGARGPTRSRAAATAPVTTRESGKASSNVSQTAPATNITSNRSTRAIARIKAIPSRSRGKRRPGPPRASGLSTTSGTTTIGFGSARATNSLDAPWSIYELHAGSWKRRDGRPLGYRELAEPLIAHVRELGFTHVELLPLMEHPFYGSWGYQTIGYFAPTARFGTPQDFKYLVDQMHQAGIGVILDWVPSHFPDDLHGLNYFDGTHLYEHADRRRGYQPEWHSYVFDYERGEVRSFLCSSAMFWLDEYHADALRVDAVASMLYLDYARKEGEWLPNEHGGRENLGAVRFLRELNTRVYARHPDVQTIAEESTAWPGVSRPVDAGGLGFGMKWNMGWMHDSLRYFSKDPLYRKHHHNDVTFSLWYAFAENFVLPLSHDEVVHGKASLLGKMPGDAWQKFANLRALLGYMFAHPGKKLLFMGAELAAPTEWNHDAELDWGLEHSAQHAGVRRWVKDLNALYRTEPALWQDFSPRGFEWIDANDTDNSVLSLVRRDASGARLVLAVLNFTPVVRHNYQVGAPRGGHWEEVLNSDSSHYGGSGQGNLGGAHAAPTGTHGRYHTLSLTVPPLGVTLLRSVERAVAAQSESSPAPADGSAPGAAPHGERK